MAIIKVDNLSTSNVTYVKASAGDAIVTGLLTQKVMLDGFPLEVISNDTESGFYVHTKTGMVSTERGNLHVTVSGSDSSPVDLRDYLDLTTRSPIDRAVMRDLDGLGGGSGGGNFDPSKYYDKTVSDARFQPKGSYALKTDLNDKADKGESYSKAESDGKYAHRNTTYSMTETDTKFALKGESGGTPVDAYTKTESDGKYETLTGGATKYQPKGNYALKSDITPHVDAYTKGESDSKYQVKGNYALKGDAYTKTETDNKFALKSDIGTGGNFDPSLYYTKVETDETFATQDELYAWAKAHFPAGAPNTENLAKLDSLTEKGRYSLGFNEKGEPYVDDYAYILVTKHVQSGGIRQEFSYIGDNHTATEGSFYHCFRVKHITKGWSQWSYIRDDFDVVKRFYTKGEADEKFQPKGNYQPSGNYALKGDAYTKGEADTKFALKGEGGTPVDAYTKTETDNKLNLKADKSDTYKKSEVYTKQETNNLVDQALVPLQEFTQNVYTKDNVYTKTESDSKYALKTSLPDMTKYYDKTTSDGRFALKTELSGAVKNATVGGKFIFGDFSKFDPSWDVGTYFGGLSTQGDLFYYEYYRPEGDTREDSKLLKLVEMRNTAPINPPYIRYLRYNGTKFYEVMHYGDSHITYRKPMILGSDFVNIKSTTLTNPTKVIEVGRMMYRKGSRVSFNWEVAASKNFTGTAIPIAIGTVPIEMRPNSDIPLVGRIVNRFNDPINSITVVIGADGSVITYSTMEAGHRIICDNSYTIESHDIIDIP